MRVRYEGTAPVDVIAPPLGRVVPGQEVECTREEGERLVATHCWIWVTERPQPVVRERPQERKTSKKEELNADATA